MVISHGPPLKKKTPTTNPSAFAEQLTVWFRANGRDYPWRRTTDPYAILVSEIMLQQTQITTVLERGYYTRWMERFSNFKTLAAASEAEVLKAWEGLGYYRRAKNLQKLARVVMTELGGVFPDDAEKIKALPGIGPYTAGAIASFAFDQPQPIVDGNVARVFSRLFDDATPIDSAPGKKLLWDRADQLVRAAHSPREFNSAIMELGQTLCRPTSLLCKECPVSSFCTTSRAESLPVKQSKMQITEITERVFFCETADGILLEQETGTRRTGMWKLPALPEESKQPPVLHKSVYGITRYRVTLWVHGAPEKHSGISQHHRRITTDELPHLPMPSPYRKALNSVLGARHFELEA